MQKQKSLYVTPQINDKKLNLKVEIADIQHEHVVGDPMRCSRCSVNIMGNSVKFTPEGGTVSLRIKELPSRVKARAATSSRSPTQAAACPRTS